MLCPAAGPLALIFLSLLRSARTPRAMFCLPHFFLVARVGFFLCVLCCVCCCLSVLLVCFCWGVCGCDSSGGKTGSIHSRGTPFPKIYVSTLPVRNEHPAAWPRCVICVCPLHLSPPFFERTACTVWGRRTIIAVVHDLVCVPSRIVFLRRLFIVTLGGTNTPALPWNLP